MISPRTKTNYEIDLLRLDGKSYIAHEQQVAKADGDIYIKFGNKSWHNHKIIEYAGVPSKECRNYYLTDLKGYKELMKMRNEKACRTAPFWSSKSLC